MTILGAIFDCDGTLVDSMGMWADSTAWVFANYGGTMPDGFFDRVESISLANMCAICHEEFGYGDTAGEVYEAVCAHVRDCYENEIAAFPGARDFLAELKRAGIPMAIASSTPVRELRVGLEAHDMLGSFDAVVSTEDVGGRDKEFPDVYLEACRRLGLDAGDERVREQVWVFEDAPFGVQTSHKAGFSVVGLMNDHDGRREEDVRPYCDIYVHGYAELSLALLEDYARPAGGEKANAAPLQVLVVDGSPEPSSPELVRSLAGAAEYVVAVDRGAEALLAAGVAAHVFVGDADSVSDEAAAWARAHARTDIRFPSEKYATDLALALDCAAHEAARQARALAVTLTCASGGRPDHFLAVVGLLAGAPAVSARMVEDGFELRILRPEGERSWTLGEKNVGRTFSAVAVAPGTRVDERGFKWELADKPMELLGDLGISNVVAVPGATATCRSGALAAFLLA
ncbi:thiamine diphosphokinase [Paratractidigestivibacter sp.]|uniref:thiamine diphosphokinase n=1 Tax=Paratractidigestivibacter sp. TaxID=2847316 RepID=UPI002AC97316|nr:thiamine diphosphokinase [Paratractidigestivibacter sp.]